MQNTVGDAALGVPQHIGYFRDAEGGVPYTQLVTLRTQLVAKCDRLI